MKKIKNNFSVSLKPLILLFAVASVFSTVIRCVQVAKFIDPETGFMTGAEFLSGLLYGFVFVCAAAFLLVSFFSKDTETVLNHTDKNTFCGAAALFLALTLGYDWISSFFESISVFFSTNSLVDLRTLMADGSIPLAGQSFFAFFSAVYFLIVALDFFKGKASASKFKILAVFPVGWVAFRLISRFIRQISFVEVSDLFLELIMLGFMAMFFMAFAQVNSGVYSDGFSWRISGFGLSAALIALFLSVTRLIFTFVGGGSYLSAQHPFYVQDLAFSVFVIAIIFNRIKQLTIGNDELITENTVNEVE